MAYSKANQLSAEKRTKIREHVFASILKADYGRALQVAERYWRKHPVDFYVCYLYSALLGDYAEFCPPNKSRALKRKSIAMMRTLLASSRAESDQIVLNGIKNEYYWQTKNRRAQYRLGVARARSGEAKGYYCQGVGAGWHAYELAARGHRVRARQWAKVSVAAWKKFEKRDPQYYNQYVHRALAEGVLGLADHAENSLARAAQLSGKKPNFAEFEEIRELLGQLTRS